ncbi:ABC-2 type transport system ATP-binding protein [Actinomyces ruminicola]|uniref:ABC-2 type transport system ATP-binding protein n=1 Tax=Actinomyces ruminicola TaxID=332524 RepID=A0A1H0FEL7_9ACTO|nr:ATP-binding cassette domain-containing protein [Actinomyces ruminicola]SDN93001.1 ABC-2 type transport system ATP-binding protein [Actinomyces ruminicola]
MTALPSSPPASSPAATSDSFRPAAGATAPPGLALRGVEVSYGRQKVLTGLNLTARPGRVYGLLGLNGAGKSTTFNTALGLLRPDAGTIEVLGRPLSRESLMHVGASINGPAFYPQLSARRNLRIHCLLTGTAPEVIDLLLEQVGLGQAGRKRTGSFSTGMKVRLALAMALLGDPEVLVLDEPQSGLDPQGIIWLRDLLRELAMGGRTVIVSSHVLGEMARTCDDVGVLAGGRMVYEGPLADFAVAGQDLEEAFLAAVTGAADRRGQEVQR